MSLELRTVRSLISNLHQMLHLLTDGFFDILIFVEISIDIFVLFLHLLEPYFQ